MKKERLSTYDWHDRSCCRVNTNPKRTMKNTSAAPHSISEKWLTTTPTMRRFLIGFTIVEAVMMGWGLMSSYLR